MPAAAARASFATPVLLLLTAALSAQQPLPRATETIDVSIVNVDVVVTDRKGNRVRGLTADDFQILENGKPQPVSNFAEYASDEPDARVSVSGEAAPDAPAQREKRTFLIFFEKMQLTGFGADAFADALKKTIAKVIQPGDSVSVVYWSRHDIEYVDAGDDPVRIANAIDFVNAKAKTIHIDEKEQFLADLKAQRELMQAAPSRGGRGQSAPALAASEMDANLTMQVAYYEMIQRVAAINASINSIAGVDGRKIFLLATRRLGEVAGGEFAYHSGLSRMPPNLRAQYGTEHLIQSIVDNANAAGITIYPVYPVGVEGDATSADYLTLGNETLSHADIARQTGGLSANGPKNVVDLLPRIVSDVNNYYSLAYRVKSDGTDRARAITVKARNPEYAVRTRTQFVEKSDDTRMRDRLKATLFRSGQQADIAIAVKAGKAKKGRRTNTIPVEVKIPVRELTLLPEGKNHSGRFSVYIGVATELNDLSDVTQKTQPFEISAAQLKQALASHFTYEMDVQVTRKSKYLAVGVLDEVGRTYGLQRVELEQNE
jgi:VWFA-related protein